MGAGYDPSEVTTVLHDSVNDVDWVGAGKLTNSKASGEEGVTH